MRSQNRFLAVATSLTLVLSLAGPALALNPASGLTSTGQTVSIEITSPMTGSRVNVPAGTLTVNGTASIGPLSNSGNVVYVVDVSGSTTNDRNQDCNGDGVVNNLDNLDGDSIVGSTLDCEIAGVIALNQSLAGAPGASAGMIVFGDIAAIADVDPASGQQNFISPLNADKNGTLGPDLEEAAKTIFVSGGIQKFTPKSVGGNTHYNNALTQLASAFSGKAGEHNIAFFLSDGVPSPSNSFTTTPGSPVRNVAAAGVKVNTYSVGRSGAGCGPTSALKQIADITGGTCTVVTDPSTLSTVLVQPATITQVDLRVNGGAPVPANLTGTDWSAALTGLQGGIWNQIQATVTASDGSKTTAEIQVYGNRAPLADAGGPIVIDEGSSIALNGTASDPDGDAITIAWAPATHLTGADTATPIFAADDDMTETLTMTVTDSDGLTASATTTITVRNVAPTAMLHVDSPVNEADPVLVSLTGAYDPSPIDTAAGFHYAFDCNNGDLSGATYATADVDPNTTCTYDDGPSTHVVRARIIDKDGGWNEYAASVSVDNVAPIATLSNAGPVDEGSPVTISFSGQYDPSAADAAAGFRYDFACSGAPFGPVDYASSSTADSTSCTFDDGDGAQMVRGRIIDKDGGFSEYTTTVSVRNVAPTATLSNAGPINEGQTVTISFSGQYDPSAADTAAGFRYAFACDGSDLSGATYGPADSITCTFDDGDRDQLVRARIMDKDGGYTEYTTTVTVQNVAPTATLSNAGPVDEGSPVSISFGNQYDPSAVDTAASFRYAIACHGEDLNSVTYTTAASATCTFLDGPGSYMVRGRIMDKDGGYSEHGTLVMVMNVAPTVGAITAPAGPSPVGMAVTTAAPFTDPGVLDTHTALWDWGDGSTSAGTVTEADGTGQVSGSHAYSAAGLYTVTLTVTDKDGGVGTASYSRIVIYDANGGFVTGGGWFDSPAGAYGADPGATGKANISINAKYQKNRSLPTGQTEFQFKAGGVDFHSTGYEWLVVSGNRAQYRGTGKINGAGSYGFLLSMIDGTTDKVRLKIWDTTTGNVVYDTQWGAPDDAAPTTVMGGGSIVIH